MRFFVIIGFVFCVLLGTGVGSVWFFLHQHGGLSGYVTTMLMREVKGLEAQIARMDWRMDWSQLALIVAAHDTRLQYQRHDVTIPEIDFIFTPRVIRTRMPTALVILTDEITLKQQTDRWSFGSDYFWLEERLQAGDASAPYIFGFSEGGGESGTAFWPQNLAQNLQRFQLQVGRVHVITQAAETISFGDVHVSARLNHTQLGTDKPADMVHIHARMHQLAPPDKTRPQLEFQAQMRLSAQDMVFAFDMSDVDIALLRDLAPDLAPHISTLEQYGLSLIAGRLSGQVTGGMLTSLAGDLTTKAGVMHTPHWLAEIPPAQLAFDHLSLNFDYSPHASPAPGPKETGPEEGESEETGPEETKIDRLDIRGAALHLSNGQTLNVSADIGMRDGQVIDGVGMLSASDIDMGLLLENWPAGQAPTLRRQIQEYSSGGYLKTLKIDFDALYDPDSAQIHFNALQVSSVLNSLRLNYKGGVYDALVGTLNGDLGFDIDAAGEVQNVTLDLTLTDGFAQLKTYEDTVKIPAMAIALDYQPDALIVHNLTADFAEAGDLTLTGQHLIKQGKKHIALSLSSQHIATDLLRALWPSHIGTRTLGWIDRHLRAGFMRQAQIDMRFDEKDEWLYLTHIAGKTDFADVRFAFQQGQPHALLTGILQFSDNHLFVDLKSGQAGTQKAKSGYVQFGPLAHNLDNSPPLDSPPLDRQLRVELDMAGDIKDLLDLWPYAPLDTALTFNPHADTAAPISLKRPPLNLAGQSTLHLDLSGWVHPDGKTILRSFDADLVMQALSLSGFSQEAASDWPLTGDASMHLNMRRLHSADEARVNLEMDFTELAIENAALGWAKLGGEPGIFTSQLVFASGRLTHIEAIHLDAKVLKARGRIALNQHGLPSHGFFEDLVFPGNDLKMILFERRDNGDIKMIAEGALLNLVPLRRDSAIKRGLNIKFDVTADRIVVGPKVRFSGNLKGETRADGTGAADLSGSLFLQDTPFITEASITTAFGRGGERLHGVGLIGGAEVRIDYGPDTPSEIKDASAGDQNIQNTPPLPRLKISSENGGRVLAGLGITDTIRNGRLDLTTRFLDDNYTRYHTDIHIEQFQVIKTPSAIRVFSVLSLLGLYGLVEGEGTNFVMGDAQIFSNALSHELKQVRAAGFAIGISLLGKYDKQTRQIDVSGNIVPANVLSELIGKLPLFGELLTGVDKAGLLVTQFSMKGDIDDPEVTTNPLAHAPGLLRDIFSPDWLGVERDRIFGTSKNP